MVGVGRAAHAGILIKNAEALEGAEKLGTLVFDKTGTLTRGEPVVSEIQPSDGVEEKQLLIVAASLEAKSEHPLARAIVKKAPGPLLPVANFQSHGGRGVSGVIDGVAVKLGSPAFLGEDKSVPGKTVVGVKYGGRLLGWIALADELRPTSAAAVARLERMGIEPMVVSGDSPAAVEEVARKLGIRRWKAGVLPHEKAELIDVLRRENRRVGMAGDGVNDAPALAKADVSFALASGSGASLDVADITLMKNDLAGIADAIALSRATLAKIRQNLFFAFVYNVLGIPLAALGMLNPVIAGAAMALSSVSVVSNSLLLNKWKPSS
jgi:Cu+-exporting ATPase